MVGKSKKKVESDSSLSNISSTLPARSFENLLVGAVHTGMNIRQHFDNEAHEALVQSVRDNGILEPLLVMHSDKSGEFTLIAGERRYRAAVTVGLLEIPCFVYPPLSEAQLYDIMIQENLHRQDLNAIEEAEGIQKLLDAGITQEELGKKISRSQEYISNRLRLLSVPQELKDLIISCEITPSHVFAIMTHSSYPGFEDFVKKFKEIQDKYSAKDGKGFTVQDIVDKTPIKSFYESMKKDVSKLGILPLKNIRDVSWETYNKKCNSCKKTVYIDYNTHCLDKECFDKVMILAEKAKKQNEEESKLEVFKVDLYSPGFYNYYRAPIPEGKCEECNCFLKEGYYRGVCTVEDSYNSCVKEALAEVRRISESNKSTIHKCVIESYATVTPERKHRILLEAFYEKTIYYMEKKKNADDPRLYILQVKKPLVEMSDEELEEVIMLSILTNYVYSNERDNVDDDSFIAAANSLMKYGLGVPEGLESICERIKQKRLEEEALEDDDDYDDDEGDEDE